MACCSPRNVIFAKGGTSAIRCVLRAPADRTWVPVRDHAPTPFERVFTDLTVLEGEGS